MSEHTFVSTTYSTYKITKGLNVPSTTDYEASG